MKHKAFSYIRFSTPEQSKGNSLDRQLRGAREYAAARGLDLDEQLTFQDKGISAWKGQNFSDGQLAAFIAACESGRVPSGSFLLVENLDRLSRRKPMEAVTQLKEILRRGVTVVTLFDRAEFPPDALDDFTKLLLAVVTMQRAHDESALKSARIGKAWEAKRRRAAQEGWPMTGMCPAWLSVRDGRFEVNAARVEVIKQIFGSTIAGHGRAQIAKMLNAQCVAPFGKSRSGWHPSSVQKILESEAVLGAYQPHRVTRSADGKRERIPEGVSIRDYFPAVIDEATFLQARAVRADRRIPTGRKGARLSNLFTGLARCGHCGGPMHLDNKGGGYKRLICGDLKRGVATHAPNSWHYSIAERFAVLALHEFLDLAGIFPVAQADALRDALRAVEGELLVVRERIAHGERNIVKLVSLVVEEPASEALRTALRAAEADKLDDVKRAEALDEALIVARAGVAEGERDRVGVADAVRDWAQLSEGDDAHEAYAVRLALQQLLKRTIARIDVRRADGGDTRYGYMSVALKSGATVELLLDDQNDDGEMQAGRAHFEHPDGSAEAEWVSWETIAIPEWWPRASGRAVN